jgi:hypothetical protein
MIGPEEWKRMTNEERRRYTIDEYTKDWAYLHPKIKRMLKQIEAQEYKILQE